MADLILALTSKGVGMREAIAVAQSGQMWVYFYLTTENSYDTQS